MDRRPLLICAQCFTLYLLASLPLGKQMSSYPVTTVLLVRLKVQHYCYEIIFCQVTNYLAVLFGASLDQVDFSICVYSAQRSRNGRMWRCY
jgi:hypothetical protein